MMYNNFRTAYSEKLGEYVSLECIKHQKYISCMHIEKVELISNPVRGLFNKPTFKRVDQVIFKD